LTAKVSSLFLTEATWQINEQKLQTAKTASLSIGSITSQQLSKQKLL